MKPLQFVVRWLAPANLAASLALLASSVFAQQNPAPAAHDMEHAHHSHGGFMQQGMHHAAAKGVKIEQQVDAASHTIIVREGPLNLPAKTDHMLMPQPPDLFWVIPVNGWLLAYTPRLVDGAGSAVPGSVLHHTAFWNTDRADFLCPNKE